MLQFTVCVAKRSAAVDVTEQVNTIVQNSGVGDGICCILVPHTTAAITINEYADPSVSQDLLAGLDSLVPWSADYLHQEGNAAAHIKAALIGQSVQVPVENGTLQLGTWQRILLCEFDGPRERSVWIKLVGS